MADVIAITGVHRARRPTRPATGEGRLLRSPRWPAKSVTMVAAPLVVQPTIDKAPAGAAPAPSAPPASAPPRPAVAVDVTLLLTPAPHPMVRVLRCAWRAVGLLTQIDVVLCAYEAVLFIGVAAACIREGWLVWTVVSAVVGGLFCWLCAARYRTLHPDEVPVVDEEDEGWAAVHYRVTRPLSPQNGHQP